MPGSGFEQGIHEQVLLRFAGTAPWEEELGYIVLGTALGRQQPTDWAAGTARPGCTPAAAEEEGRQWAAAGTGQPVEAGEDNLVAEKVGIVAWAAGLVAALHTQAGVIHGCKRAPPRTSLQAYLVGHSRLRLLPWECIRSLTLALSPL